MAKNKFEAVFASSKFRLSISEPTNGPAVSVLDSGLYYICCHGYAQAAGTGLAGVWAKVYTSPLPDTSTYITDGKPDPTAQAGQIDPGNVRAFFFKGSQHGGTGLIQLAASPAVAPVQYLYVWGQRADNSEYAIPPADVVMSVVIMHQTHCGDTAP